MMSGDLVTSDDINVKSSQPEFAMSPKMMLKHNNSFAVGGGSDLSTTVIAPSVARNPNFAELGAGLIKDSTSRNKINHHHSVDFKSVYKRSDSGIRSNITMRGQ